MISAFLFFMIAQCPMHDEHMKSVDARHDTFGMDHQTSHHRFRMFANGGAIELRANDPADAATIRAIRKHLRQIAASFSKNDFSSPLFVHARVPDGVETMQRLHRMISYHYEDVDSGGRVRITTADPKALAAVHDFVKFQIEEHRTGDRGVVEVER